MKSITSPPNHSMFSALKNCAFSESNCFSLFPHFMYRAQYLSSPFFTQFQELFMRTKLEGICRFCWLNRSRHYFRKSCRIHHMTSHDINFDICLCDPIFTWEYRQRREILRRFFKTSFNVGIIVISNFWYEEMYCDWERREKSLVRKSRST